MKQTYGYKYLVFEMHQAGITWVSRGSAKDVAESLVARAPPSHMPKTSRSIGRPSGDAALREASVDSPPISLKPAMFATQFIESLSGRYTKQNNDTMES